MLPIEDVSHARVEGSLNSRRDYSSVDAPSPTPGSDVAPTDWLPARTDHNLINIRPAITAVFSQFLDVSEYHGMCSWLARMFCHSTRLPHDRRLESLRLIDS
jgi:hypothetical protein